MIGFNIEFEIIRILEANDIRRVLPVSKYSIAKGYVQMTKETDTRTLEKSTVLSDLCSPLKPFCSLFEIELSSAFIFAAVCLVKTTLRMQP